MRWVLCLAMAVGWVSWSHSVVAQDDELQGLLERWLDDPLNLATVDAVTLAQLPWLEPSEAEAIVALREWHPIVGPSDLRQIPGLDADRIRAVSAFVRFMSAPGEAPRARFELGSRIGPAGPMHRQANLVVSATRWRGAARWDSRGWARGWLRWSGRGEWWVGDVEPVLGWGLLFSASTARSSTRGVRAPRTFRLRGTTRSGRFRPAVGIQAEHRRWSWLAFHSPGRSREGDAPQSLLALQSGRGLGAALRRVGGQHEWALWWYQNRDHAEARLEWAGSGLARRAAAALVKGLGRVRLGAGWSFANGYATDGLDPITGASLDREHRALQLDATWKARSWSSRALLRRVWRGRVELGVADRVEWRVRARESSQVWEANLRVEPAPGLPPLPTVSLQWERRSGPTWWRLRTRRQWSANGQATLSSLSVGVERRLRFTAALAGAGGVQSSPWWTGLAGAGVVGQWMVPGRMGLGLGVESTGGWWGAWTTASAGPGDPPRFELGFRIRSPSNQR